MAQDFERTLKQNISNNSGSPTELRAAANSDDAIIGVRCTNTSGTSVNVTVYLPGSNPVRSEALLVCVIRSPS